MRRVAFAAVFLCWLAATAVAQQAPKKRVAVFDFDNAAGQGGITSPFFQTSQPNLGKATADLLIAKLVKDAVVSVIERDATDKLLNEQNLTNSDRSDPHTAAKLGKILGVDGVILGTITHYDYDDKTTGGGGSRVLGFGGYSTSTKHDIKAHVQISVRLVSPETAEVLAVSDGIGDVAREGVKEDLRDTAAAKALGRVQATNPLMNEALDKAIVDLAVQLEQRFPKLPDRSVHIEGLVADANESGRLVLNIGSKDGVKEGDRLQVLRKGKEIRDPATGKLLLREDTSLGEAIVTTVNDISSLAQYKGTEKIETGDLVKNVVKDNSLKQQ